MDPAIELATLVVAYLWPLKELDPSARRIADLESCAEGLHLRIAGDYALVERLRNVASRSTGETWELHSRRSGERDAGAELRDIIRDRIAKSRHSESSRLARLWGTAEAVFQGFANEATPADYGQLTRNHLKQFVADATALCRESSLSNISMMTSAAGAAEGPETNEGEEQDAAEPSATTTQRGDLFRSPISRERFTTLVAFTLLRRRRLAAIATLLDFCPVILRQVRRADEEPARKRVPDELAALLTDDLYPAQLLRRCVEARVALPFSLTFYAELEEVERQRLRRRAGRSAPPGASVSADRSASPPAPVSTAPPADAAATLRRSTLATYRAFRRDLIGLSLSGGGIRSATFALGVLQGLANKGWLTQIDYLSTVSGGGYIGSWLAAWVKRRGSVASVQSSLQGYHGCGKDGTRAENPDPGSEHLRPIRLLREFSTYLAPRSGAFSTDTWTIGSIWLRNTLLNLLTLTLFLMAALMMPRILGILFVNASLKLALFGTVVSIGVAALLVGLNLQTFEYAPADVTGGRFWKLFGQYFVPRSTRSARGDTSFLVLATIVTPMMLASFFAVRALWAFWDRATSSSPVWWWSAGILLGGIAITAIASQTLVSAKGLQAARAGGVEVLRRGLARAVISTACGVFPAVIGATIVTELWTHAFPVLSADTHRGTWLLVAFGPVAVILVISTVIVLYLGFEGLAAADERREWWSRLGAWLSIVATGWAVVTLITYFSPYLIARGGLYLGSLAIGWGSVIAAGAWLAAGGKSNGVNLPFDRNVVTSVVITAAPYLFMLGFLVVVTSLAQAVEYWIRTHLAEVASPTPVSLSFLHFWDWTRAHLPDGSAWVAKTPFSLLRFTDTYWSSMRPDDLSAPVLAFALFVLAFVLAWRVDVNEFSMHHFYRNRLIRAYLGASRSRRHRRPNAFTGLDMEDDIKLWRFTANDPSLPEDVDSDCRPGYDGPFPVINTTLNMTTGDELAYRERKGQSFFFTPLYCGFDFATKQTVVSESVLSQFALRPSREFGSSSAPLTGTVGARATSEGLGVGTSVAISGAAANPNAGYHSSPAVAFLLTVLNARLGWWIGNPRRERWRRASPLVGLTYLLSELFGFSGIDRQYVNLSDGGHFDNVGLYELIRRRCRYIIVVDSEQDETYSFNGLAGAIRKCRVDFGVVIEIDTEAIRPAGTPPASPRHVAIGRIAYPEGCGILVYIKASMTGDEPMDVKEYHRAHEEFPHQTTADQFFNESQFETYRALGQHITDGAFPVWLAHADEPWEMTAARLFAVITVNPPCRRPADAN